MNNTALNNLTVQKNTDITTFLSIIAKNEADSKNSINLVASENMLSPLAKLPFLLDLHARYYLEDMRRFKKWYFPGGSDIGEIEETILIPLLSELAGAAYVNVRPISGMNCMTIALNALTEPHDTILSIPLENGGHVSTPVIVKALARKNMTIPFANTYDIDYNSLEQILIKFQPALIYIDQATFLFPIDPQPIRNLIDSVSPKTILHYDSSHINGLIIGKALFNPLQRGAHCYGGSTHKTLPGPHKGFLAANDPDIATRLQNIADHFVSHHHTSSMLSLTVTLLEMKWCNGDQYAKNVIANSKIFAKELKQNGFHLAAADRGFTDCHQIWAYPQITHDINQFFLSLNQLKIMTNLFDGLPGINQPAFRLSTAEITRLGATSDDIKLLAALISDVLRTNYNKPSIQQTMMFLSERLSKPEFCFNLNDFAGNAIPADISAMCKTLFM